MHDRHCTSRQLPYDACLLWPYAARNSREIPLSIFLFSSVSQPVIFGFFQGDERNFENARARMRGEKERSAKMLRIEKNERYHVHAVSR